MKEVGGTLPRCFKFPWSFRPSFLLSPGHPGTPFSQVVPSESCSEDVWPMRWTAMKPGSEAKDALYLLELASASSPKLLIKRPAGDGVTWNCLKRICIFGPGPWRWCQTRYRRGEGCECGGGQSPPPSKSYYGQPQGPGALNEPVPILFLAMFGILFRVFWEGF